LFSLLLKYGDYFSSSVRVIPGVLPFIRINPSSYPPVHPNFTVIGFGGKYFCDGNGILPPQGNNYNNIGTIFFPSMVGV
jgi:hypothetical protein